MPEQEKETSPDKNKRVEEFATTAGSLNIQQHLPIEPINSHTRYTNRNITHLGDQYDMSDTYLNIPTQLNECETYRIPEEIRNHLPITPDHIEEARAECVRQFITKVFLRRMVIQDPLLLEELISLATQFKLDFTAQHPNDFVGEFEIITSVEMELMNLYLQIKQKSTSRTWMRLAHLVKRALYELKRLLDEYPDKLFSV